MMKTVSAGMQSNFMIERLKLEQEQDDYNGREYEYDEGDGDDEDEEEFDDEEGREMEQHDEKGSKKRASRPRPKCYHCAYDNCGKSFTRPCRLEEHIRCHTGERPFACTYEGCSKNFLRDSHLKAHQSSHCSERRYSCTVCGHGFNTNQHLKRHMLTHEKSKPYQCQGFGGCSEAFHKQTQLRKHVSDAHTHMKPFVCSAEGCGRSFDQNSRLKAHEARDHSGQARYLCGRPLLQEGSCEERFQTWSALQRHLKSTHKAVCGVCGLEFAKAGVLRQHERVHRETLEQRRKFVCEVCQRGFTRQHALAVHRETVHEGRRPFECGVEGCGRAFGHKRLWAAHLRTHEPGYEQQQQQHRDMAVQMQSSLGAAVATAPTGVSVIDRLAGTGYTKSRPIACAQCEHRFMREYDYERHLAAVHRPPGAIPARQPEPTENAADDYGDHVRDVEGLLVVDPSFFLTSRGHVM
ncbi:uncharacterized protein V2V93DRAFT_367223 [Kockiozyma suomiensis]|uniref:uncharacterized protein n=1 Tax=Kockiozyma suomiensis TaxID=1337062 RepID=UPI0033433718